MGHLTATTSAPTSESTSTSSSAPISESTSATWYDVVAVFFRALDANDLPLLATTIHPAITFHALSTEPSHTYSGWEALLAYLRRRTGVGGPAPGRELTTLHGPYVLSVRWQSDNGRPPICVMAFGVHERRIVEAWDLPIDVPLPLGFA